MGRWTSPYHAKIHPERVYAAKKSVKTKRSREGRKGN